MIQKLAKLSLWGPNRQDYQSIWDLQKKYVDEIYAGQRRETIIFCEHELLITCGRRAKSEQNILDRNIASYQIERGGDVTLHGPGQIVIYPLIKLNSIIFKRGLHEYLRFLEEVIIRVLADFHLDAGRFGPTGVWIRRQSGEIKKIASIGIAVRHWVTYHGIALNFSSSILESFKKIRPCDFESAVMTSLEAEGIKLEIENLEIKIQREFEALLEKQDLLTLTSSVEPSESENFDLRDQSFSHIPIPKA